jgi:hypothetical protein
MRHDQAEHREVLVLVDNIPDTVRDLAHFGLK